MKNLKQLSIAIILFGTVLLCNSCFLVFILPPKFGDEVDVEYADIILDLDIRGETINLYASTTNGRRATLVGARSRLKNKKKKIPLFSKMDEGRGYFYLNQNRIGIVGKVKDLYAEGDNGLFIDILDPKTKIIGFKIKNPKLIETLIFKNSSFDTLPDFSKFPNLKVLALQGSSYNLDLSANKKLKELHLSTVDKFILPDGINFEKFSADYEAGAKIIDLKQHNNLTELSLGTDKIIDLSNNPHLKVLDLRVGNEILDLSNNTEIEYLTLDSCNNLKELKGLRGLKKLKELHIRSCGISEIDLSLNSELEKLEFYNNKMYKLILKDNRRLTELDWSYNKLENLEISNYENLAKIKCYSVGLENLSISNCPALEDIDCLQNKLKSLTLAKCSSLKKLICANNEITSLSLESCNALEELDCFGNDLSYLDCSSCEKIKKLTCYENKLASLNLENCATLEELYCNENELTSLDCSDCKNLNTLNCYNNKIQNINLSGCSSLGIFDCHSNELKALNLDSCASLSELSCQENKIGSLNLSKCQKLRVIDCFSNELTKVLIKNNNFLYYVNVSKNKMKRPAMDKLLLNLERSAIYGKDEDSDIWVSEAKLYYKAESLSYPDDNEEPSQIAIDHAKGQDWILGIYKK